MGIKVSVMSVSQSWRILMFTLWVNFFFLQGDDDEADVSKPVNEEGLKTLQKQEEMFRNLDVQYEMARSQTHTQRGMGLGFSSSFSRGMDSI